MMITKFIVVGISVFFAGCSGMTGMMGKEEPPPPPEEPSAIYKKDAERVARLKEACKIFEVQTSPIQPVIIQ